MTKPTKEELTAVKRNEENLWDLTAITSAPTFFMAELEKANRLGYSVTLESLSKVAAHLAYDLADHLMTERHRRFLKEKKDV